MSGVAFRTAQPTGGLCWFYQAMVFKQNAKAFSLNAIAAAEELEELGGRNSRKSKAAHVFQIPVMVIGQ